MEPGQRIGGRYEVEGRLGAGGMGEVVRALDLESGRRVAVKLIRAKRRDERLRARFAREAESLGRLDHPNVVKILDSGQDGNRAFLVMELVEGESLGKQISRLGALEPGRVREIGAAMAAALEAVHAAGLLHRDVKPDNVLLERGSGRVVLTDFGLVSIREANRLTRTGEILGTPAFMAPEQAEGDRTKYGPATDIYGVGATLYMALTGRVPFSAPTNLGIMRKILSEPPPSVSDLRKGVDAGLDGVVGRCLAKDPADRFTQAADLGQALQRPADSGAVAARAALLLVAGGLLASAAIVGGWGPLGPTTDRSSPTVTPGSAAIPPPSLSSSPDLGPSPSVRPTPSPDRRRDPSPPPGLSASPTPSPSLTPSPSPSATQVGPGPSPNPSPSPSPSGPATDLTRLLARTRDLHRRRQWEALADLELPGSLAGRDGGELLYLSGDGARVVGRHAVAGERLERAVRLAPSAQSWLALAELQIGLGQRAVESIDAALSLSSSHPRGLYLKAPRTEPQAKQDAIRQRILEVAAQRKDDPQALTHEGLTRIHLGDMLRRRGQPALAEKSYFLAQNAFNRANRRGPLPLSLNGLGELRLRTGDNLGALRYFEQALELDPYQRNALDGAARVWARLERIDRARPFAKRLLELEPGPGHVQKLAQALGVR